MRKSKIIKSVYIELFEKTSMRYVVIYNNNIIYLHKRYIKKLLHVRSSLMTSHIFRVDNISSPQDPHLMAGLILGPHGFTTNTFCFLLKGYEYSRNPSNLGRGPGNGT
ncbi:hypothetical protein GDO81_018902 [Engystomops pustulosus]|uniref:Uncharacterized protein n=1 Tax=Engystomops pustulosus TaxID=76066 RepID=A0AAV6YBP6_ENGPU|nr:hypothetical protein GDO81_018902 [Engystomops pustulosus]